MQLVEDGVHECHDQAPQLVFGRDAALFDLVEQLVEPVERVLMAREEDLFLVAEVVVQVPLLHVQRGGDFLDRRAVIAEPAERGGGAFEDLHPRRRARVAVAGAAWPAARAFARPGWYRRG